MGPSPFLTAEWRMLVMFNYVVDPSVLTPYLPYKTELDFWQGRCYVSLVGFMFQDTRLKGFKIPFHETFEEVNLRFYVRHFDERTKEWKRGVVFIKEIVPKFALTFVANTVYGEHYETMPMSHSITHAAELHVSYRWKYQQWHEMKVACDPMPADIQPGSEDEFITEHYWGYTRLTDCKTSEYPVQHPRWQVYAIERSQVAVDFSLLYGEAFGNLSKMVPTSVLLAEGSPISVGASRIIR